jgi:hypothetical protein
MRIDLSTNEFKAYNFMLRGENSVIGDNYNGSYLEINSNPSIRVHVKDAANHYDIDLLNIDTTQFLL